MTKFRPCIDLHGGQVKQIVGGTLSDDPAGLQTNFESDRGADYYAGLYREDQLEGGHVIMLGPGNEEAAKLALATYPGGLQVGGGIHIDNAELWLEAGASHIIVTSWLFEGERFLMERLDALASKVGTKRIVVDLSCRRVDDGWRVATNRWQTVTRLEVSAATLDEVASYCAEFLIHAADVEGKCEGIDQDLVRMLGDWGQRPMTYAGGANSLDDLALVEELSAGKVDLTIGSALDLFGGKTVAYADCVAWNQR